MSSAANKQRTSIANNTFFEEPGSACPLKSKTKLPRASSANAPSRRRATRYTSRRAVSPRETEPGHTLTSSVEPALIACLRWHGLTSECARERAARLDLLRLYRVSASIRPRHPRRCSGSSIVKRSNSTGVVVNFVLPDRTHRCCRPVLAARPSVVPTRKAKAILSAARLPPPAV